MRRRPLLVALCISRFARYSSSPGSLYTYASMTLPSWLAATAAWSLLLAYIATGSSVIGGFYHYANLLLHDATGQVTSAVFLALIETLAVLNSSEEQISEQEGVRPRGSL